MQRWARVMPLRCAKVDRASTGCVSNILGRAAVSAREAGAQTAQALTSSWKRSNKCLKSPSSRSTRLLMRSGRCDDGDRSTYESVGSNVKFFTTVAITNAGIKVSLPKTESEYVPALTIFSLRLISLKAYFDLGCHDGHDLRSPTSPFMHS